MTKEELDEIGYEEIDENITDAPPQEQENLFFLDNKADNCNNCKYQPRCSVIMFVNALAIKRGEQDVNGSFSCSYHSLNTLG